ncbi:MAG: pyrroloquinoline quinone biosynthesis protein PqqB [Gemmatimonadota bacterium]
MKVILLGTAAGGGFPQWNCWCPTCRTARLDPSMAHPRTQSSVAVSANGSNWFLLNASPDVRTQLGRLPHPTGPAARHVPIDGIVFTDAELDHTLGLVLLREAGRLTVWATDAVVRTMEHESRVLAVTRAFADVPAVPLPPGHAVALTLRDGTSSGLTVEAFEVAGHPPRFDSGATPSGHTVGLLLRDAGGACCAYVPGCGAFDEPLAERLAIASLVLFDGTFWSSDELVSRGFSTRDAHAMGHLPIGGTGGSLARLAQLPGTAVYTHINNTNPILLENSAERAAVEQAGMVVGRDGMEFTL